jgi:hypothetical protein
MAFVWYCGEQQAHEAAVKSIPLATARLVKCTVAARFVSVPANINMDSSAGGASSDAADPTGEEEHELQRVHTAEYTFRMSVLTSIAAELNPIDDLSIAKQLASVESTGKYLPYRHSRLPFV